MPRSRRRASRRRRPRRCRAAKARTSSGSGSGRRRGRAARRSRRRRCGANDRRCSGRASRPGRRRGSIAASRPGSLSNRAGAKEQRAPDRERGLLVERERERMRLVGLGDRRQALQVGEHRVGIGARQAGVVGIRKRRVQQAPVARAAVVQRAPEVVAAPGTDAGRDIGRQVGRVDVAERGLERPPAGIRRVAGLGMAAEAAAGADQVFAARDQIARGDGARLRLRGVESVVAIEPGDRRRREQDGRGSLPRGRWPLRGRASSCRRRRGRAGGRVAAAAGDRQRARSRRFRARAAPERAGPRARPRPRRCRSASGAPRPAPCNRAGSPCACRSSRRRAGRSDSRAAGRAGPG